MDVLAPSTRLPAQCALQQSLRACCWASPLPYCLDFPFPRRLLALPPTPLGFEYPNPSIDRHPTLPYPTRPDPNSTARDPHRHPYPHRPAAQAPPPPPTHRRIPVLPSAYCPGPLPMARRGVFYTAPLPPRFHCAVRVAPHLSIGILCPVAAGGSQEWTACVSICRTEGVSVRGIAIAGGSGLDQQASRTATPGRCSWRRQHTGQQTEQQKHSPPPPGTAVPGIAVLRMAAATGVWRSQPLLVLRAARGQGGAVVPAIAAGAAASVAQCTFPLFPTICEPGIRFASPRCRTDQACPPQPAPPATPASATSGPIH